MVTLNIPKTLGEPPVAKSINFKELEAPPHFGAAFRIDLLGFTVGESIEIILNEDDSNDTLKPKVGAGREIGSITGKVIEIAATAGRSPLLSLTSSSLNIRKSTKGALKILVRFPQPYNASDAFAELEIDEPSKDSLEGEYWEFYVATTRDSSAIVSPTIKLARFSRPLSVQKQQATYNYYAGHTINCYHDGSTDSVGSGGYFKDLVAAIKESEHFIFIADWSFHPHFRVKRTGPYDLSSTIGGLLIAHAAIHRNALIAIHTWDHTNLAGEDNQNDNGSSELDSIARSGFGMEARPANLLWKASSRTGVGYSHHQKFIVMNGKSENGRRQIRAFIGGIDLAKGRFDWPYHAVDAADRPHSDGFRTPLAYRDRRENKEYDDWYNPEFLADTNSRPRGTISPRQPWHDIAMMLSGPSCWDVVAEFVGRWLVDPSISSASGDTGRRESRRILEKYFALLVSLKDHSSEHSPTSNPRLFIQQWEPSSGVWSSQVLRSMTREHWDSNQAFPRNFPDQARQGFNWTVRDNAERSIQDAYLQAIPRAQNYIYIETQFLISSGNGWGRPTVGNDVVNQLVTRAVEKAKINESFHIYIVIPMFPEGDPSSGSNCAQRQFQWNTIAYLGREIQTRTKKPASEYLSILFPAKWSKIDGLPATNDERLANVARNRRYQIYVHSKFMLIDDRYMIIGSANLNERSLAGNRDSEIAIHMWPSDDASINQCIKDTKQFRHDIWAEHLGPKFNSATCDDPSSSSCVKLIRDAATENYAAFREGRFDSAVHGHLCLWPLQFDNPREAPVRNNVTKAPEGDSMIPDRPFGMSDARRIDAWRWHAPGRWTQSGVNVTAPTRDIAE